MGYNANNQVKKVGYIADNQRSNISRTPFTEVCVAHVWVQLFIYQLGDNVFWRGLLCITPQRECALYEGAAGVVTGAVAVAKVYFPDRRSLKNTNVVTV